MSFSYRFLIIANFCKLLQTFAKTQVLNPQWLCVKSILTKFRRFAKLPVAVAALSLALSLSLFLVLFLVLALVLSPFHVCFCIDVTWALSKPAWNSVLHHTTVPNQVFLTHRLNQISRTVVVCNFHHPWRTNGFASGIKWQVTPTLNHPCSSLVDWGKHIITGGAEGQACMFFHTTAASYGSKILLYHHAGRSPDVLWRANRKFRPSIRIIPTNNKAAALVLPRMRDLRFEWACHHCIWGVSKATLASPAQRSRCTTRSRLQTTPPPSLLKPKNT